MTPSPRDRRIRMAVQTADTIDPETTQSLPPLPHLAPWSTPTMNQTNSAGWITYTYASFGIAGAMTALGIWGLPADLWVKGYLAMAVVFLTGATFTLAKTIRDEHEGKRLANRIEDAKTEKILMGIDRA